MIKILSDFFEQDYQEMLVIFLSDRIASELKEDDCSIKVLNAAKEKIIYFKRQLESN